MSHKDEILKLIEAYLKGELSATEKTAFEEQLKTDSELAKAWKLNQEVDKAVTNPKDFEMEHKLKMAGEKHAQKYRAELEQPKPSNAKAIYLLVFALVAILIVGFFWINPQEKEGEIAKDPAQLFADAYELYDGSSNIRGTNLKTTLAQAQENYKKGKNKEAIVLLSQLLENENLTSDDAVLVRFYSGIAHLADNQTTAAKLELKRVLEIEGHAYTQQSQWYLALTSLKEGDAETARKWLRKVIATSPGKYANQAEDILGNMTTGCGTITESCFTIDILDMIHSGTETEITVRLALDQTCTKHAVSHVSFGLPPNISAISPADNSTYTSNHTGLNYTVENMTNNPFHSIKFNTADKEGIGRNEDEIFVFTVPRVEGILEIPVEIKKATQSTTVTVILDESCIAPMPVELIEFVAEDMSGDVSLIWSTASEENSSHFEVERSTDGKNWKNIGKLESHHNSTEIQTYFFVDNEVPSDRNYYRLKMVDLDETFEYSKIIMVQVNREDVEVVTEPKMDVKIFPNPVSDLATVSINSPLATKVNMRLLAAAGNVLLQNTISLEENENTQEIDMSAYPSGIYFLVITRGRDVQTHRIVKQK